MPELQPDLVIVDGTTSIMCLLYPLRAEDAFYDTDRTVPNPTELLTSKENIDLLKVETEIEHTHSDGVELDPHRLYYVAALPRRWGAGGPVLECDSCTVLLSENRGLNA